MMAGRGRRPGHADTRAEIVASARAIFIEEGYAAVSMRAIARRAGVDPALVHHYFADKAALFAATMALPIDPRQVSEEVDTEEFSGERLIELFLAQWEQGRGSESPAFVSLMQAIAASPQVAENVRQFVAERVGLHGQPGDSEELKLRRRSLVGSQLLGIACNRYLMRMDPMASASRAEVARWVGPTIDRYAMGNIDE
jgi:AcrR family transcriptional regulator